MATTCQFCLASAAYLGTGPVNACAKTDGSAAHTKAPNKCKCATDACATGKFCFARSVATKCANTALADCGATKDKGDAAATADCKCGKAQAIIGEFCIKSKNTVNKRSWLPALAPTAGPCLLPALHASV